MTIRVLIADDHTIVRTGLRALIAGEAGMELVGEATCGEEALEMTRELRPDVLVLDLSLPDMDGIRVTHALKREQPDVRVLILTVHEDETLMRESMRAGASGYVLKHAAESELVAAIHTLALGGIYVHRQMIGGLFSEPETPGAPAAANASSVELLTPREIGVLRLVVQGYTNRQIAEELALSVRTVEGHRANLTAKLGMHSRVELARYAREHGLTSSRDQGPPLAPSP
jgi:two-component system response regulator NreC